MSKQQRVDFQELKARADFGAVLAHYGLAPVGTGDQVKIRCPFHDDERPSCSVNLAKGLWQCFAGCGAGNVLDFVHRMEAREGAVVSLRQAGLELARICGLARSDGKAAQTRQEPRRAPTAEKRALSSSAGENGAPCGAERATAVVGAGSGVARNKPLGFRLTLDPTHPYLEERGLSPALIELFGLGYCAKGVMQGRVAIPIHNAEAQLVAYAGRWAGSLDDLPEGEDKYQLPKGFHKALELWNLHRVEHCRHLVVVEGFFAAIRLHSLRIPTVALMGSSLSEAQVALLLAHCPALRCLTVMLDGDEPGRKATEAVAARLARQWWTRSVALPEGKQPDTMEAAALAMLVGRNR